jgi:hypothetical protein
MMPRQGGQMNKQTKKSFVPLIIILIGGALIFGALLVIVLRPKPIRETPIELSSSANSSEITRIPPNEAKIAFDEGKAVFVDVRAEEYYLDSHIPGALSIPLAELPSRLDELDQEAWIILY